MERSVPILRADWQRHAEGRVQYWWSACERELGAPLGAAPTLELSTRLRTTAGLAIPFQRHIKLSFHMMRHEGPEGFDSTIAHEVAHIACDLHYRAHCHHDARWVRLMVRLGLPPDRCHEFESTRRERGREVHCPGCERPVRLGPIQWKRFSTARASFSCNACGTRLVAHNIKSEARFGPERPELSGLVARSSRAFGLLARLLAR